MLDGRLCGQLVGESELVSWGKAGSKAGGPRPGKPSVKTRAGAEQCSRADGASSRCWAVAEQGFAGLMWWWWVLVKMNGRKRWMGQRSGGQCEARHMIETTREHTDSRSQGMAPKPGRHPNNWPEVAVTGRLGTGSRLPQSQRLFLNYVTGKSHSENLVNLDSAVRADLRQ